MKKFYLAVATAAMLATAGSAFAAEPMVLTNQQMDSVTAGGIGGAVITLVAAATGTLAAATESQVTLATALQAPLPAPLPSQLTVAVVVFYAAAN